MKQLVFIVKPASTDCNLSCIYCYHGWLTEKQRECKIMSIKVLKEIFFNFSNLEQEEIEIIWHGGEPLLAGKIFFGNVLEEESKINKKIVNIIQTNGTLLDQEWARILKRGRFRVGISVDGPEDMHDFYRVSKLGRPTFKLVKRGIAAVKDLGVPIGPISVITKGSISRAKEIFSFLYNSGLKKMNFSPCPDIGESYAITGKEYGEFLLAIFEEWMKLDDPDVKIVPLSSFMQVLVGGHPTVCYYKDDCSNFLSIDSDGSVYVCGRSVGIESRKIGNVKDESLGNILKSEKYLSIKRDMSSISSECKTCEWLSVCNGGCPLHRDDKRRYLLCDAVKLVLPEMKKEVNKHI